MYFEFESMALKSEDLNFEKTLFLIDDFECFGKVHLKNATVTNSVGAVNEQKTFYLNEQQATLLMTYLKNSEIVRGFKMALVDEFFRMREQILRELKYTKDGKNVKKVLGAYKSHSKQAYKRLREADKGIVKHWMPYTRELERQNSEFYRLKEHYKNELEKLKKLTKRFKFGGY